MRRHAGCDERDGGLVDGRQGHDPGSTIGADGLRPLYELSAVIRMTRSLRGRILLTAGLPFGGRKAGVFPRSSLCGIGLPFAALLLGAIHGGEAFEVLRCRRRRQRCS